MKKLLPIFKALSDRNRFRVVAVLIKHSELCGCQIIELLQIAGATVSRHMGVLISAGIVESRKEGRWIYYRLLQNKPILNEILNSIKNELEKDLEIKKDKKVLKEILKCDPEDICRKQRGEGCCPSNK